MEMDKTGLESRTFSAFAETAKNQYIYLSNMSTGVSRWSKSAVEYFGMSGEYMIDAGREWAEHIHPDERQIYMDDIEAVFSGKKNYHILEYRARNKDGNYVVCTCNGIVLKGNNGEPDLFAGTITNHGIIDNVDPATNLYNIYEFMTAAKILCEEKVPALILAVGLNKFSEINNQYGYVVGNKVLQIFAAKLMSLVSGKGFVYRMDGAKFAFIIRNMGKEEGRNLYSEVQRIAEEELIVKNTHISLSVSGGAVVLENFRGAEYPIRASVMYALDQSKHDRRNELVFFENKIYNGSARALDLMSDIRQDVLNGCSGFYLCYQPLVGGTDGTIVGMEALVRWNKEPYGEVSPGEFIPFLENDTCFFELGNWILKQALTDGKLIVEQNPDFIVNVNISHTQLERNGFRDAVTEILRQTGFPPKNLCLELTERCRALDTEYLREEMNFFRTYKIKFAVDDFGTGFSSLGLIHDLAFDCLKIDRSFISNIHSSKVDQTIVQSIITMANELEMKICLEGIENLEIKDFVMKYAAKEHQGYYYSYPVRIDKFMELIK